MHCTEPEPLLTDRNPPANDQANFLRQKYLYALNNHYDVIIVMTVGRHFIRVLTPIGNPGRKSTVRIDDVTSGPCNFIVTMLCRIGRSRPISLPRVSYLNGGSILP